MRTLLSPLLLLALTAPPAPAQTVSTDAAEPIRLSTEAFGRRATVEVRDLPAGENEAAARAALVEVLRLQGLTDPRKAPQATDEPAEEPVTESAAEGGAESEAEETVGEAPEETAAETPAVAEDIATLNARAGSGPQPVSAELLELLVKAQDFCVWSRGAHGPLGGRLRELWGFYQPVEGPPSPAAVGAAVASAACGHLRFDRPARSIELDAASRLDPSDFAVGWAVDRAVEVLREHGAGNGLVEVGAVRRGFGPGPDGRGWKVLLPIFPGSNKPLGEVWLRDQALAVAQLEDRRLTVAGGEELAAYLDLRRGEPTEGVVAVIAVTELAVDAQGLATTLFATGNREGQFLLGQLRPSPSVRWLLGDGDGIPLITDYNWGDTRTR
jgi:thiamine biosynthesis lipoprotein